MYCDNCGQKLREGAKFCPKCGTRFMDKSEYAAQAKNENSGSENTYSDSFEYKNYAEQTVASKRKKNGKSKAVYYVVAGLFAVAAIFAAVMIFLSMNSGMTPQKAYKKYFKVLQEDRGKVVDFEEKSGSKGVAITDINDSGIPDVLYITDESENGSGGLYLHTLTDNEKDIEVDAENYLTGAISEKDTLFSTGEDKFIYMRSEDELSRRIFSKDDSGNSSTMIETLAKRTVDDESGEYVYMILTDSGYLESVEEKEYNNYIDSICGQNVTIIITSLSEDELNKQFPSVEENISESCDDSIEKLKKKDIAPVGADNTEPKATEDSVYISIEPTEPPEEKDREFVKNHCLVKYDDVVYFVDENGLWMQKIGSDKELLYECKALNLATDGRVIYYGVFNEEVEYQYYSNTIGVRQYDMYRYDLKTGNNEKLFSCIEAGRPLCAIGDILYYTDYSDDFDGNQAGLAQSLRSYNMATGEKNFICRGAHLTACCEGKIFYRELMAAGGGYGVHQIYCYDTVTGETEMISDDNVMGFIAVSGKIYYEIRYYNGKSDTSYRTLICAYDVATGETEKLFETDNTTSIQIYDDKYIIYSKDNQLYQFCLATGEDEEIPKSLTGGVNSYVAWHFEEKTVFSSDYQKGKLSLVDNDSMEVIASTDNFKWQSILTVDDNNRCFYIGADDNHYYLFNIKTYEFD